jgi:hypothetical protein
MIKEFVICAIALSFFVIACSSNRNESKKRPICINDGQQYYQFFKSNDIIPMDFSDKQRRERIIDSTLAVIGLGESQLNSEYLTWLQSRYDLKDNHEALELILWMSIEMDLYKYNFSNTSQSQLDTIALDQLAELKCLWEIREKVIKEYMLLRSNDCAEIQMLVENGMIVQYGCPIDEVYVNKLKKVNLSGEVIEIYLNKYSGDLSIDFILLKSDNPSLLYYGEIIKSGDTIHVNLTTNDVFLSKCKE